MDGVLVIDKPQGLTSHDVVVWARRTLREPRIGHTGTLDPLATGVLPLACGSATRLVQFLGASDKDYTAEIRFGLTTDTYDVTGEEVGRSDVAPTRAAIEAALRSWQGEHFQAPPPFSAKKIGGRRAYALARARTPVQPEPVGVRVTRLALERLDGPVATLAMTCSAGFYVRSLAHAVGEEVGAGACLQALRRTRSGEFSLDRAVTMEEVHRAPSEAVQRMTPMAALLPHVPRVMLTAEGRARVSHGREVSAGHASGAFPESPDWVRLIGPDGALVALARRGTTEGSLHPAVVLI
jgi:tRNA pseudouridine55 synthase